MTLSRTVKTFTTPPSGTSTYALVDGVEWLLLERSVSVRLEDVVDVGEEQVAEEVGGLPRQLGRHVVDAAHQHAGAAETATAGEKQLQL